MLSLLKELSELPGVSGAEEAVRERLIRAIEGRADSWRVDALGNLLAVKKAREGKGSLKVMLAAHMDEVGLMVTHINKDGFLTVRPVGEVDGRILLAKRVAIGKDKVPGVIGLKPIHLLEPEERDRVIKVEQLAVDIGASDEEEAKKKVKVGDVASFTTAFEELAEEGLAAVKGKALDDRAGCALLVELLEGDYPLELHAAFTVQEEVGLRGARVAAYAIEPDAAFVLESTVCDDLPKKKDTSPGTRMGKGPAITIADRAFIAAKGLVKLLVETAETEGIPYQFKQPNVGSTDAGAIHLAREGVPTAAVSIPTRYIHSPASLLSLKDFENTLKLMRAALSRLTEEHIRLS
ncbi:MAG: M42 family metallopeptidase [Anaerolineae bacterium]